MIRSKYLIKRPIGLDRMLLANRKKLEDEKKEEHRKLIVALVTAKLKKIKKRTHSYMYNYIYGC